VLELSIDEHSLSVTRLKSRISQTKSKPATSLTGLGRDNKNYVRGLFCRVWIAKLHRFQRHRRGIFVEIGRKEFQASSEATSSEYAAPDGAPAFAVTFLQRCRADGASYKSRRRRKESLTCPLETKDI
jgi:hypothetical protein